VAANGSTPQAAAGAAVPAVPAAADGSVAGPVSPSASHSAAGRPGRRCVAPHRHGAVALTFDDGPDPVQTPLLLDLLKEQGVKATFCMVGFRVRDHPDLVRRIAAEGHTLCNHSWQHLTNLAKRPVDYIKVGPGEHEQRDPGCRAGREDRVLPGAGRQLHPELVALAKQYGMSSIYWQVDPRDWDHKKDPSDPAHIARVVAIVQRYTKPGSIVLSHDNGQPDTIEAYRTLLPWLKERFELTSLPV
jgi:peptidoglycan/xylan/chitin deacetylase (PgdA/CDA1 family)